MYRMRLQTNSTPRLNIYSAIEATLNSSAKGRRKRRKIASALALKGLRIRHRSFKRDLRLKRYVLFPACLQYYEVVFMESKVSLRSCRIEGS